MFGSYSSQLEHPLYGVKMLNIRNASSIEEATKLALKSSLAFIEQERSSKFPHK